MIKHLHIEAKNTLWLLNRITNMVRKKHYDMIDFSVSFASDKHVLVDILMDAQKVDIVQITSQLKKLYDIYEITVYDANETINHAVYIDCVSEDELKNIERERASFVKCGDWYVAMYVIDEEEKDTFYQKLNQQWFEWRTRMISLI